MAVEPKLSDQEIASLMEIPHPSKGTGESIYGATKVFPDYQAEPGETYLGMVHGIVARVVGELRRGAARRSAALKKGFDSALYFFGIGALNCLADARLPDDRRRDLPRHAQREQHSSRASSTRAARSTRAGSASSLHGAREEDLMEGVIPCHPLDMQDAMIEYSRKGAIINTTWMF